jgi:2-polyprenyl-3-methyl-5-hydroxy-6-metoxy-1,4-benzoquinol methylase
MFNNILYKISAERTDLNNNFYSPFYYQQLKAYEFCTKLCVNKNVLEIGFGGGHGAFLISNVAKKIIGIDSEKLAVFYAKQKYKRKNLNFIEGSIENFKVPEEFDCIISLQVIEHIPTKNIPLYFKRIKSLIKPKGILILSTPYATNFSYNENPYHFREYTFQELKEILSDYFSDITMYSLIGDSLVRGFEKERKHKIESTLNKDIFKLRNLLPRKIKQLLFDLLSYRKRTSIDSKYNKIVTRNYKIIKGEDNLAIDIITICKI